LLAGSLGANGRITRLFAAPPPAETPRDRCIAAVTRWTHGDYAAATARLNQWTAAIGIDEVERLIAAADSGRHGYAPRLAWVENQTAKIRRRKTIEACAAPRAISLGGCGAANGAGADVVDISTPWRLIVEQLARWGGSIEAAESLARRMVAAFGGAKAAAAYIRDMRRCHRSGPDHIAAIERRIARSSAHAEPQAAGRADDASA
jgi:hypothetical protein